MSYRIVIAEDSDLRLDYLQGYLEDLTHQVVGCTVIGDEAIAMAISLQPDLVLATIKGCRVDFFPGLQNIAAHHHIPTIIITDCGAQECVQQAADAGVMMSLLTPVSLDELQATIHIALARFHELDALRKEVGYLKQALEQRKMVERAKGILMDRLHLSEQEAFRRLQQLSQQENRPMLDIAQAVVTTHILWEEHPICP